MVNDKVWLTGEKIEIKDIKTYALALSGAKILIKERPPVAKEVSTD
ncbi:MAG: hypothetical protein NTY68_02080 [Candidatus Micrarchaeota archaeon]|nr:hypothetical protein [Candidatus Micrarchaeota archaeon]